MESKTCTASEQAFRRLSDILDTLRKECPWDKAQTMKSLRYLTIEEVHELSEALHEGHQKRYDEYYEMFSMKYMKKKDEE